MACNACAPVHMPSFVRQKRSTEQGAVGPNMPPVHVLPIIVPCMHSRAWLVPPTGGHAGLGALPEGRVGKQKMCYLTMVEWLSSLSRLISRMAVLGTPSSSASTLIFFRATNWLLPRTLALYTVP